MEIRTGEGHGVARNAIYLLSGKIISTVLGVIFVIYVAIQLGLTQFGIYTLGNYFAGLFVIIGDLGLSNYTTREIARDKNNAQDILNRVFCLRLVLSLLAFIVGINVLLFVDYGLLTEQLTMIILFTHIFFRSFLSFLFHIFEGFERMEFVTIAEASRRETKKKNAPKPKIIMAPDLPVVEVTVRQHAYFTYNTGMSGDEQGVKFKVYAKHAKYSNILRDKTTGFEVIYRYRSKPDYVGKDSVELEYSDHQLGSGPDDPGTTTITRQVINITVEGNEKNEKK